MSYRTPLEAVIEAQGRKQKWLADRLGVHESEVSRYLNGGRKMPAPLLKKAAEILGVPVEMIRATDAEPVETAAAS